MANAVSLFTLPVAGIPLYFWNAITACVVAKPYLPSGPEFQKPRSSRRCWTSLVFSPLFVPTAGISCAAHSTASTLDGRTGAGGRTTPAGSAAAGGATAGGAAAVSGGAGATVSVGAGAASVAGGAVVGSVGAAGATAAAGAAATPAAPAPTVTATSSPVNQATRAVLLRLLMSRQACPSSPPYAVGPPRYRAHCAVPGHPPS